MAALAAPDGEGEDDTLVREMDACVSALSPLLQRIHQFMARRPLRRGDRGVDGSRSDRGSVVRSRDGAQDASGLDDPTPV